jgi:hypothetical protein
MALPEVREEVIREKGNVLEALPERWELDRNHTQAVQKILTQRPLGDTFRRIPIRRGNEPHIHDSVLLFASDPTYNTVLQHAKQLRLERQRHFGELVQE